MLRGSSFATRLALTYGAMDLTFKVLVGAAFIQVMGGRSELVGTTLMICAPVWVAWLVFLWWLAQPIDRCSGSEKTTPEQVALAGKRCGRLPLWLATLWSIEWVGAFCAVIVVDDHGFDVANLLFLVALVLGPFPLAHALAVWMVAPQMRSIELAARYRTIALDVPASTIRGRMMMYAVCLVIAPSAYMAAIGVGARIHVTSSDAMVMAIALGFGAVAVFAVLTALLVASAFTRPIVEIATAVRVIAHDTVRQIGRVPQYQRDEMGELVTLTNEMLERLERTENEREVARAQNDELVKMLESYVDNLRESYEHEMSEKSKTEHELAIAQRIQTSILPRQWNVDELEIAATMVTATAVGGDYYDILPRPRGGWIGIGDVSGHGVSAGLIMMMVQSITAALVDAFPDASARDLVIAINRVLFANVRHRLQARDFVTFTLLRYEAGRFHFAGAHEDIIVWRAKTKACERIATPGTWIGAVRDLEAHIVENTFELARDDLMVLYTDGIIEAVNANRDRFGLDRLCELVESLATQPVDQIVPAIVEAARQWCVTQEDDMSIIVARQR